MRRPLPFSIALTDTFISSHPFSFQVFVCPFLLCSILTCYTCTLFYLGLVRLPLQFFVLYACVCSVVIARVVDSVSGRVSADEFEVNYSHNIIILRGLPLPFRGRVPVVHLPS